MHPKQLHKLIKECVLEVLQQDLLETLEPTSQGPNIPQENPYPAWNSKMRTMEEEHPHGRYAQQAGATPLNPPYDTSIVEEEGGTTAMRVKKQLYPLLADNGFRRLGQQPRDYMEYYLNGFATVGCSVFLEENKVFLERYYDSERLDTMPGYHVEKKIPIPEPYQEDFVRRILLACLRMKRSIEGDESIMGGSDEDLQETSGVNETLELTPTGGEDDWSRPIYKDQHGKIYVDINLGQGEPSIHTVTDQGEPETPVHNFKIVGQSKGREFPNALCPRCKNSKPELMTNHPDGTKTCNFCHWSNSSS